MVASGEQPPGPGSSSGGEGPDWQGLLKWSLAHSDGTRPARQLSEEDRKWFAEAVQSQTLDVIQRMKEITMVMQIPPRVLESQGVTVEELEGMLEELQEHVESIDMANDLHAIGGLIPLLGFLRSPHPSLRARAAEVVSTIVQNNPKSQQQILDNRGLELLVAAFNSDPDVTVRTKALGAISSLIRHNKAATAAFRLANGFSGLKEALVSDDSKLQRKALQVLLYLLQDNPSDRCVAVELGFPRILMRLAVSYDADIRQTALNALVEILRLEPAADMLSPDDKEHLKKLLSSRMEQIMNLSPVDLGMLREERHFLDAIWQLCFGMPSPLREKGLLVLPEDESPPPDVTSARFEPVLRAAAASQEGKADKKPPLLIGPGP